MVNIMDKNNQPICEIDEDGDKHWYLNGELHREDGPAAEYVNGSKYWYLNNQLHRLDGPAVEYNDGTKWWYLHGQRHRIDGPAYEGIDGYKSWYYHGKRILCFSQREFERLINLKALW